MTEADLNRIEAALGFALPTFYRVYMRAYPRDLRARQPEWLKRVTEWEFADDPDRIIAFNRSVRAQEDGWFFDDRPWPDELLVIGSEYDQNYFAVNRRSGDEGVLFWSHEDGSLSRIAESLSGYRDWLVQWWDDIRRDNER
ncbi:MAG: SMI1/KNR4 family protein [Planctomycetia bacterium]|nr:SMI1/KNR4 family protein [Planctomycetia bacterium]